MSSRRGMTLIEVLISVTLLSVLSVAVLLTLRVGLNALEKTNTLLIGNRRAVSVGRILHSELAGFMPAGAVCPGTSEQSQISVPFFEGGPQSMRFVSSYSLQEAGRGLPRILEFLVIPGAEGKGVRLVVNETPYGGPWSTLGVCLSLSPGAPNEPPRPMFRPIEAGPQSFVLADRLASCSFRYRARRPAPEMEVWVDQWTFPDWPTAIHVDIVPLEPQDTRAPLVSVNAPVRVNRRANESYGDY